MMEDSTACIRATVIALASCQPESQHWQKLIEKFADADIQDKKAQTELENDRVTTRALTSIVSHLCTSGVLKDVVKSGYLDEYEQTRRSSNHQNSILTMVNTLTSNCSASKSRILPIANEVACFQFSDNLLYVKIQIKSSHLPEEHCLCIPNGVCHVRCELVKSLIDIKSKVEEKLELPTTRKDHNERFIISLPYAKLIQKNSHTFDTVLLPNGLQKIYIVLE